MEQESRRPLRLALAAAVFAVGAPLLVLLSASCASSGTTTTTASAGSAGGGAAAAQQQSTLFMGGNPETLGTLADIEVRTSRLRFPAGVRSNWHTHEGGGQLLMIESGRGLHQVRGGPLHEMRPNEPWYTAEGVEHWHGAHPDEAAVQWTIYGGTVNWLEPVQDNVYRARAVRPQR